MLFKFVASGAALALLGAAAPVPAQDEAPFVDPRIAAIGGWDRVDHDGEDGSGFVLGGIAGYMAGLMPRRVCCSTARRAIQRALRR
ncbi:hypothetical protein FHS96_002547 [Sphingomonas zeicaulis]|uniref:hypothetical protein n=1 Tax=Sphingomonas zeicaulis TaxID=1632740 RepID=UPI003D251BD0